METFSLPKGWTKQVRSSLLRAIALTSAALKLAYVRAGVGDVGSDLEFARNEIALLREELALKQARFGRLPPRRRPHYTPTERLRILQLRAARSWSLEQASEALLLDIETIKSWLRRVDEDSEGALVRTSEPVNRFPDYVRYLVRQLKVLCPSMGKVRIAQVLARAGLQLAPSTVRRIVRERGPLPEDLALKFPTIHGRQPARKPGELWHLDLTAVPTGAGFWVPWFPFTLPQRWPFCWWVLVVLDHVSRSVVTIAIFRRPPSSSEIQLQVATAIARANRPPRWMLSDKGGQFWCRSWRRFCRDQDIRPRYGAIGRRGSIAVVERFILAMKQECTSQILVPLSESAMQLELRLYTRWYNENRPSQALGGRTPDEAYRKLLPAIAALQRSERGGFASQPQLIVGYLAGRRHLPVVELRRAA